MTEQWKPVAGYEGLYEVSDLGNVRSVDRVVWHSGRYIRLSGRALHAGSAGHYLSVSLSRCGSVRTWRVHTLVLEAFVGPRPEGMEGLHWDDDPSNNRLENLRWGTDAQNQRDLVRNGKHWQTRKTHCPKGHPYSGDNLLIHTSGGRRCRICRTAQLRAASARRAGKGGAK